MQLTRFIRTSGLLLVIGLAGLGGGCGPGTPGPTEKEQQTDKATRENMKKAHQQLKPGVPARGPTRR
jgi:hypothetical protein